MKLFVITLLTLVFLFAHSPIFAQSDSDTQFNEVDAINNRCIGTLPGELCVEEKKDDSLLTGIVDQLKNLFIQVSSAVNFNQIIPRAEVTQRATFPVQQESDDKVEQLDNSLCAEGTSGVYGAYTPKLPMRGN